MSTGIYLGTDPEFFVVERKTRKAVPAHKFFPGKDGKVVIERPQAGIASPRSGQGAPGRYFRDGYALEINPPGTHCRELLAGDVVNLINHASLKLPPEYDFSTTPTVTVDFEDLKDAPEDVKTFGCDPSYDAYDLVPKVPFIDAMSHPYRYGGGHMHFSYPFYDEKYLQAYRLNGNHYLTDPSNYPLMVKMLDLYVGVPLGILLHREENFLRRLYYGQAGEYRPQIYPANPGWMGEMRGLEYRSLGGDVFNSNVLVSLAFGAARRVLYDFQALKTTWNPKIEPIVRQAVNSGIGLEGLLQTVPGFYTPEIILAAKAKVGKKFLDFNIRTEPNFTQGWTEFVAYGLALNVPDKHGIWKAVA